MPSLLRLRTAACIAVMLAPACVVNLVDRNSPKDNGGVTGAAADCSKTQALPRGSPQGEAAPKFVGRFASPPEAPGTQLFDWSGNYITVRFQGTSKLTVKLQLLGAVPQDQMFAFSVDDLPATTRQITVKKNAAGEFTNEPLETYDITNLAANVAHEVTIHKNTEAQKGSVLFKGFELNGGTLLPPTRRARRMEFIGDSIICGYGNEGKNATCPFEVKVRDARDQNGQLVKKDDKPVPVTVPITQNQYLSFTSLAARELDADAVTICWSGKGVYKNYKERFVPDPANPGKLKPEDDTFTTVPELWNTRTIGNDFEGFKWDWAAEKPEEIPQVVFISLGTNDYARDTKEPPVSADKLAGNNIPDGDLNDPAEREKFFQKYLELVKNVRTRRPDAHIFVATPPMITDQFPLDNARRNTRDALLRIVAEREQAGDRKVYQMDLVEQGFRYGLGCDYHPNLEVHRIMATQLVGAVRSKTCW